MYKSIPCTLWLHYTVSQRATLLGKVVPLVTRRSLIFHSYSAIATPICFQEQHSSLSSLPQNESNIPKCLPNNSEPAKITPKAKYKHGKQAKKLDLMHAESMQSSDKEYKEWKNALEERDPIKVWETMQPFILNHTLSNTPISLMEATFRLMHTRGTSVYYNVIQNSTLDDREQVLFDCFLDTLFKHKVQLFKWELIALWMQRERERGRPLRILLLNHRITHRILSNRTAIRGVALEETIMAASHIDPKLMELLVSDKATNEYSAHDNDNDMDMTLSMRHPARNMPILRNMILCALSPSVRLSTNAWCSLLEWTAFRTPPMIPRLLEKAHRDGFVLSGALGERLLVGSTLREPYSLPVIYQLYKETIKAKGRPDQRSVSRLLHLLLKSNSSNDKTKWTPEEKLKIAYDIFRQELAIGRLPHASANRLLISQLVKHHRHFEARYVYNECRSKDQGYGRQSLIYSAIIYSYIIRRQLSEARQLVVNMFKNTLRRQADSSSPSGYTITGPQGEPVALRLRNENEIELYNSGLEEGLDKHTTKDRVVVCTLWPHAQTAGVLIDAYGRCGDERHYQMAQQLYEDISTQWGIYHESLTAPMMRVYLAWGQPERALNIATEALKRGAHADVWMTSAQIQGLAALAHLEEAEDKLNAFVTSEATSTPAHVLQRLYHALALGHAQQGNLDQVRRIYTQMRTKLNLSVPLPDSWTAHMIAASQRNSISDVCAVKQELEQDGYILGDQNYAIALLVFAKQQNLALVQQWFDQILASEKNEQKEKRIVMTRHIITAMLQAYTRSGHSNEGYLFWCDMRAKYANGVNSPTRIDNALLSVLLDMSGRGLGVKETEAIWHMATVTDRLRVNGNNGAALVEAYMRHGELEKAVNTMKQYKNDPTMHGMGIMLSGLRTRCEKQKRHDLISELDT